MTARHTIINARRELADWRYCQRHNIAPDLQRFIDIRVAQAVARLAVLCYLVRNNLRSEA